MTLEVYDKFEMSDIRTMNLNYVFKTISYLYWTGIFIKLFLYNCVMLYLHEADLDVKIWIIQRF